MDLLRREVCRSAPEVPGKCVAQHPRCLDRRQAIYKLEHYLPLLEKKGRAIFYARPVQDTLPRNFLDWLQKQRLSPKELVELLRRCQEEDCDAIMTQSSCHAPSAQIQDTVVVQEVDLHLYDAFQDTVVVQEVDLHLYDAFLRGKVGAAL